ncbi:uncharacterized protein plekhg4 isoform X1 [Erpetoichthys calabaricus]|uniref:Pleckstrin homology domain containing, family G (with RhoGef domain) member 4 n=2 Tax=Erpetoichthys calabaricus TaxID=27687 RepID=A0A8C4SXC7_ERPCA|nr:uncharacterized protein plekhg4 isoform X1 [Erpetoichthys calabaricus]
MDSEALDSCIQNTLSVLYPPFEATAATVLCQVFDVVEKTYRGDGLRYLTDFLVPSKHILQCIQQDACFQYCGFIFRHEGWPLCIHEKVIVHLASLDWRRLQPGDFYLQIVPYLKKTPRIVLKCLSTDKHNIEELEVPDVMYTSIFTKEWLESINRERMGTSLEYCLLSTDSTIFRVPWEEIVCPEFISRPEITEKTHGMNHTGATGFEKTQATQTSVLANFSVSSTSEDIVEHNESEETDLSRTHHSHSDAVNMLDICDNMSEKSDQDLEGDYVELADVSFPRFCPQKGSLTESLCQNYRNIDKNHGLERKEKPVPDCTKSTCTQSLICKNLIDNNFNTTDSCEISLRTISNGQQKDLNGYVLCKNRTLNHVEGIPSTIVSVVSASDSACYNPNTSNGMGSLTKDYSSMFDKGLPVHSHSSSRDSSLNDAVQSASALGFESSFDTLQKYRGIPDNESMQTESTSKADSLISRDMSHNTSDIQSGENYSPVTDIVPVSSTEMQSERHSFDCCDKDKTRPTFMNFTHTYSPTEENLSSPSNVSKVKLPDITLGFSSEDIASDEKVGTSEPDIIVSEPYLASSNLRNTSSENLKYSDAECSKCMVDTKNVSPVFRFMGNVQYDTELSSREANGDIEIVTLKHLNKVAHKEMATTNTQCSFSGLSSVICNEDDSLTTSISGMCVQKENCLQNTTYRMEEVHLQLSVPTEANCKHSVEEDCQRNQSHAEECAYILSSNDVADVEYIQYHDISDGLSCEEYSSESHISKSEEGSVDKGKLLENNNLLSTIVGQQKPEDCVYICGIEPSEKLAQATDSFTVEATARIAGHGASLESHEKEGSIFGLENGKEGFREGTTSIQKQLCQPGDKEDRCTLRHQESLQTFKPSYTKKQSLPCKALDLNQDVLHSGVIFPGTRDKCGRGVVIITTRNTVWLNPSCNSKELVNLLLYFYAILRKDVQAMGLTVLVDARRCSPVPALFKAFNNVQSTFPGCIHAVLLLAERDLTFRMEKPTAVQVELLTSLKSLHKHIDGSQLPLEFDGTFPFCYSDWVSFRMKLEQLTELCETASTFLCQIIESLRSTRVPSTAEEAEYALKEYKDQMKNVLEDKRLVMLQLEGGSILSRLKKEESCVSHTDNYRDEIETVMSLYNQVDELVHCLVMLSNKHMQELEFVVEFKTLEEGFKKVCGWIEDVGESRLGNFNDLEDSLESLRVTHTEFKDFYASAYEYCKTGEKLLKKLEEYEDISSSELQVYEVKVHSFWKKLKDFSQKVEDTQEWIDKTVKLYEFFDKAYEWALEGMRRLASITMEDCSMTEKCGTVIKCLEEYHRQHPDISEAKFLEMKELACELKSEKCQKQWKFAWSKCQETKQMFEKKLEAALRTRRSLPMGKIACDVVGSAGRRYSEGTDHSMLYERSNSISFSSSQRVFSSGWSRDRLGCHSSTGYYGAASGNVEDSSAECVFSTTPILNRHAINQQISGTSTSLICRVSPDSYKLTRSVSADEPNRDIQPRIQTRTSSCSSASGSGYHGKRQLRKTQSFDVAPSEVARYGTCQRTLSEPARHGNTGVFIKGLEVSSTEIVERPYYRQQTIQNWTQGLAEGCRNSNPIPDSRAKSSKLRHIIEEMVMTERDYVRSLRYIIDNYFPEMERFDLPQDLRGKRSIIFGNLEKLYDFHSQYFLKELESCCNHPLRVSHCFLRHQDQFGMYALYSKNKPKSDSLLASHGNIFFRFKQLQLEDKMDLASYLLKPIQRMSKYALLLKDLFKECSEAQEQELSYLRAAAEMVKFQLRHGNDLLAMDAIRDCDVNLKEQGQLVRQDEFTVWYGRKKCQRHVFLFEDLVLFSKPKRIEGGLDVYIYKHSFKTADVGLTENCGESGMRFEIWFRRRKSKNQTYVLQASTPEIKQAWTTDVAKILWQQATRNKEIRMQEMVSMGVGNKPFLDIKPSDAAINDRAIDYIMKGRGARTRASIAVSLFDHSDPFKRTQTPISATGTPIINSSSSSSLLGPLNLHMYTNQSLMSGGVLTTDRPFCISTCIEEDEQEHETSSQPSMTTESSESSSHCMSGSGSSGSDSGCVSSILPENLSEEPGSPCDMACYSYPASQHSSSATSPLEEKAKFSNSQYISAKSGQIISPSTVV